MPEEPAAARGRRATTVWITIAVLAGVAGGFGAWSALEADERTHLQRLTEQTATSIRSDLEADLRSRFQAQVRLAELWGWEEPDTSLTGAEWTLNCRLFLDHHPGEVALQWVDTDYRVRWAMARDVNRDLRGLDAPEDLSWRPILQAAAGGVDRQPVVSPVFRLPDGPRAVRVAVAVVRDDRPLGFLVALFNVAAALETMLDDHAGLGFSISVVREGDEIYRTSDTGAESRRASPVELALRGTPWHVRVRPNPALLSASHTSVPELAAILAGLLCSALVITGGLGAAARRQSNQLRKSRDQLEERVRERTSELQQANATLETEISHRRRAEESLRNLSRRLLLVQDGERRRIARELNEGTMQLHAALAIDVDQARQLARERGDKTISDLLQHGRDVLNRATQELKEMSRLLHPPLLDELGLGYVLPWFTEGFSQSAGIAVDLSIQDDLGRLPEEVETTLFRVIQEALTNVHRHSGSQTASVRLFRDPSSVTLEVRDQGRGLPSPTAPPAAAPVGTGIAGMRERVRQLGGELKITSDGGTIVRAVLPLSNQPRAAGC